jgi:glycogen operon protein
MSWQREPWQEELLAWTKRLVKLRREHLLLRRRSFFRGRPSRGAEVKDIYWLQPDGTEMTEVAWRNPDLHTLGVMLPGSAADLLDEAARLVTDDTLLMLINASEKEQRFVRPPPAGRRHGEMAIDSSKPNANPASESYAPGGDYDLAPHSLALLVNPRDPSRS